MPEQGRAWRVWRQPGAWSVAGRPAPRPRLTVAGGDRPSVVLVDDSAEVRTLVRTRLRITEAGVVVGEGSDGADAIDLAARLHPDAMLLDVSMPGLDGLEALPRVLEASPDTRVVMFSGFAEEALAARALDLGAASYVVKSAALDEVVTELLAGLVDGQDDAGQAGSHAAAEGVDGGAAHLLDQHVERFRSVFDDAAIGMATMTLQGTIVRANEALCRIAGRPSDELLGGSYAALVANGVALQRAIRDITDEHADVVTVEHQLEEGRYLRTTLSVVRDDGRHPLYLFAQCQDVTPERAAELRLRESERRFRLLVEAVRDYAIFMLDPEGRVASWNRGAERTKGWRAEEIIGQHFRIFYPPEQQESRHPEHELELALRDGVYAEEGWRVRRDGTRFWAHVTITAVHDDQGRHIGFAKVTRDHTERMEMLEQQGVYANALAEANQQLERANAELAAAAEEQARFLAATAHELRTPVGVLAMSGRALTDHWQDLEESERDEIMAGMEASAARLQRLLGDLLTTARLEAATLEVTLADVDLAEVVATVVRRVHLAQPEMRVESDVPAGLRVRADADRLAQVIDNLVTNALVHGRPPVRIEAVPGETQADICITDAGDGVPPHLQGRIFGRFATSGGQGTGLGLHIAQELARAQGGDVRYEPATMAFIVSIPLVTGS